MDNALEMWVITEKPTDYADLFVARLNLITDGAIIPTDTVYTADSLQAVRRMIPQGLVMLPRHPTDSPVVVETWF
jgi:hypothetical protein